MKIIQVKTHKLYIIKKRSNNKFSFIVIVCELKLTQIAIVGPRTDQVTKVTGSKVKIAEMVEAHPSMNCRRLLSK